MDKHAASLPFGIIFLSLPILLAQAAANVFGRQSAQIFTAQRYLKADRIIGKTHHNKLNWSDVKAVRFIPSHQVADKVILQRGRGDALAFDWPNNVSEYVNLDVLSSDEKQQLYATVARVVPQELLSPEALFQQLKILQDADNEVSYRYTNVWLKEYNKKFSLTNYAQLPPGAELGNKRYQIQLLIAGRANSSLYLSNENIDVGRQCVIKELVPPISTEDELQMKLLEQFNREASLLASMQHSGVVSVYDHFVENDRSYLVMEHIPGQNLREHVQIVGVFRQEQIVDIALQLINALNYMHNFNPPILHRDLSPDNIMLSKNGVLKIIDFGAASLYNAERTATLIGKRGYMPPEQIKGEPGPPSDVYALGAALSYLLTGHELPCLGKLPESIASAEIGSDMRDILARCVAYDVALRPSLCPILKHS